MGKVCSQSLDKEFRCHRIRCARSIRPLWIVCASPFQNTLVLNILPRPRSDSKVEVRYQTLERVRKGGGPLEWPKYEVFMILGTVTICYFIVAILIQGILLQLWRTTLQRINSQPTHHVGWLERCNFTLCLVFI